MKPTTKQDYRDRVIKVIEHIQGHLDSPLALDTLAQIAHFSPYHFHRIFRLMVGETLADHIRRHRLKAAASRMRDGASVIATALDCGYENPESFSRAFKGFYGLSPSTYAQAENPPEPNADAISLLQGPDGLLLILPESIRRLNMNIELVTLDAMPIAFVPHSGNYDDIGGAFQRIAGWAAMKGFLKDDTPMFGRYYDDPDSVAVADLRSEACVALPDGVEPDQGMQRGTLAGGLYAKAVHKGPYTDMKQTYDFIYGSWMPDSGQNVADAPCVEMYLNNPETCPPAELITEIYIPLKT